MNLKDLATRAGILEGEDYLVQPPIQPLPQSPQQKPVSAEAGAGPNPAYDTLAAHTSFETTDAGKVYRKYYDKLSRITDEHQRRQTAIDLAGNDGIDRAAIASAFEVLGRQMQAETDLFNTALDANMKAQYQDPKAKADEIGEQIAALQTQRQQILDQLQPAFDKLTARKAQFQSAWERRKVELDQQRKVLTEGS